MGSYYCAVTTVQFTALEQVKETKIGVFVRITRGSQFMAFNIIYVFIYTFLLKCVVRYVMDYLIIFYKSIMDR